MKKCPSCGRAYSDMVNTCPTCGIDISGKTQPKVVETNVNQNSGNAGQGTQQAVNTENKAVSKKINPVYWIVYIVVGVIAAGVTNWLMETGSLGVVIGSIGFGALIGLIPFLAARSKGKKKLGTIAMVVTIIGSFIAGMYLSIPSAIIFTVIALKK